MHRELRESLSFLIMSVDFKHLKKMGTLNWMQIVLSLLVCIPQLIHGEVVHITLYTAGYTSVGSGSWLYQCYRSDPDEDATLSFGRSAPITTDRSPQPDQQHSDQQPYIRVITFPTGDGWDRDGFGPFYCEASKPGRDVTRVTTFFQRYDAKFISNDGMFTKTVNVNDTGVVINMVIQESSSNLINWRKDGGGRLDEYGGQTQIFFSDPIQTSDEGIYEIYYDTERNDDRGGLYRLIVRECPAGKWGPPECYGICDKCYNGGVCDDKSGLCICPNNFNGTNCLDICRLDGGNRFGLNCEFQCSYPNDRRTQCHGSLFCLPDPYGCSCDVGAHGHACRTLCTIGTYGAGCTQTCHCAGGSCDIYSGVCSAGCQTGWLGDNCQIPDVCEAGYYGDECTDTCHCLNDAPCDKQTGECPQRQCAIGYKVRSGQDKCRECEGGRPTFGVDCSQSCHCAAQACETERGLCNGQCIGDWIEPDCQTRVSRLVPVRVNPYQPSSFTCYVQGNPPPDEASVSLYRYSEGISNDTGISRRSSSVSGSELAVVFDVDSVYLQEYACYCTLDEAYGLIIVTNTAYVLPVIEGEPVILSTTATTVRIQWNAWSEGNDTGDPPVVGYDVYVRRDGDWLVDQRVDQPTTSATVDGLNPDTEYRFSVAAVRECTGGTGPRSPEDSTKTLCGKPSSSPTGIQVSATNEKELELTWQSISPESAECRSGVTHYVIYYTPVGSTSPNLVSVYDATSYILTELETYLDYTIQITASNKDEESDRSSKAVGRTLEEIAPPPVNVNIPRSTISSFTVSWSAPLPSNINGNIQKYIIRYQQTNPDVNGGYMTVEVLSGAFEEEHTISYLPPETNYIVQVQTVNAVGSSEWSEPVNARSILSGGNDGTGLPVGAVVGGVMASLIITLLIIGAVVFYRRIKQRRMEAEPPTSAPKTASEASQQYDNPAFDKSKAEPHIYQAFNADDTHTYEAMDSGGSKIY